jgi:methylenetetrahydrofolate--tRNA-(uracil-5-)-methyltransferase
MNINYGLLPPLDDAPLTTPDGKRLKGPERGLAKKKLQSRRALSDLATWLGNSEANAAAE